MSALRVTEDPTGPHEGDHESSRRPRLARSVIGWILTVLFVGVWFMTMRPQALGGPTAYVGVSGHSMLPTLHNGDMTIVEHQSSYHVGDVVAYTIPKGSPGAGLKIIHRIKSGDGVNGFVTQGDHNGYTDTWHPTNDLIVGKVRLRVPGFAGLLSKLRSPAPLAAIVFITTFLIVVLPDRRRHTGEPVTGHDLESEDDTSLLAHSA